MSPASPMPARSQQLLTHMAKKRVTGVLEGGKGEIPATQSKPRARISSSGLCLWVRAGSTAWLVPAAQRDGAPPAPPCLPTPLASPVPSRDRPSHPGFVQETWVRSSPRADVILPRAAHGGTRAPAAG